MQFECLFPMIMFLGAFAKLPKTILHLHICPSVRMEQLDSHWKDFNFISHLRIFSKNCRENSSFIKIWQDFEYFTYRRAWWKRVDFFV